MPALKIWASAGVRVKPGIDTTLRGCRTLLVFLAVLIPSAQFAWRNRNLPRFAVLHDDGISFVTAKSVAANHYKIESLPEQPFQTKYPPLYPLYLSAVWRLNPNFPDNLRIGTLLSWLSIAVLLALAWVSYRQNGFTEGRSWLLVALLGINPYLALFGSNMFSDVFFTCWVLAALLSVWKGGMRMAVLGGALAGLAYLSRTAGIALLISVPAYLVLRKQPRRAIGFAAAMLPAVLGWTLWTRAHRISGADETLIYYTDYFRYQLMNVRFNNLAVVVWKNFGQLLYSMGALVLPKLTETVLVQNLTQVIGVAMVSGTIRLARRGVALGYALFVLVSMGVLLVWHFPPTERFVLPLYPLLLAGLIEEIAHLGQMVAAAFRKGKASQRAVASALAAGVLALLGTALVAETYTTFSYLSDLGRGSAAELQEQRSAYKWIADNLPPSATVLSYDDPLLYLYTGRRGNRLTLPPRWWYAEDHDAIVGAFRNVVEYCRSRGLQYVYYRPDDGGDEMDQDDRSKIERVVHENPRLEPVFQAGSGTIYRVKP